VCEIADLLARKVTKAEAYAAGALATRQYAKRQYTWFANQTPTGWQRITQHLDCDNIVDSAIKLHKSRLTA
jgi:tRNA dimethylallyltransferase